MILQGNTFASYEFVFNMVYMDLFCGFRLCPSNNNLDICKTKQNKKISVGIVVPFQRISPRNKVNIYRLRIRQTEVPYVGGQPQPTHNKTDSVENTTGPPPPPPPPVGHIQMEL